MKSLEVYRVEKKRNRFFEYFFVIVISVIGTLLVERSITEANKLEEYASYLSYESDQAVGEAKIREKGLAWESVLESTVGIGMVKPSGLNVFDVNVEEKWGLGTGIIVSKAGYILTNQHLAQKVGASVIVTLKSGKSVTGKIMWTEKNLDLAILKIDEKNLTPLSLGNSQNLKYGETVYAIGNPLGVEFKGSITKGIVSGLNRTILFKEDEKEVFMEGLIQTDASINPGNSGGPLVNEEGEVVGINTIKITSAEGIGFAVPVSIVKNIIAAFEEEGSFEEASLGIFAYDNRVIPYLGNDRTNFSGIYVASVDEKGPAANAGIIRGDIITMVDGMKISEMMELREYLYQKKPGDKVTLMLQDNKEKEVTLRRKSN